MHKPFILVTVEGGIADYHGDTHRVDVELIDYDISELGDESIDQLDRMIESAERIPSRLAALDRQNPHWIDKHGILATLREDLARALEGECGHAVFVNEEGIVPRCDVCNGPQRVEGDDWNGETGNHHSCEMHEFKPVYRRYTFFDPLEEREVEEVQINDNAGCMHCGCSQFHPLHFT